MLRLILVLFVTVLISCSSGGKTLKYDYLPKCKFQYYAPLKVFDLKKKKYRLNIQDFRPSYKISCSEIPLPKNEELDDEKGLVYFENYLRGMIEENNGLVDPKNGQEIQIDLNGLSSEIYGHVYYRIFGLVEFIAKLDGKEIKYCSEMADSDEDSPLGGISLTQHTAARKLVAGSVRRVLQQLIHDLSTMN